MRACLCAQHYISPTCQSELLRCSILLRIMSAAAAAAVSPAVSSALSDVLPPVDQPVLDYFTAIVVDLLPAVHSPAALASQLSDLLLNQECVDTQQQADAMAAAVWQRLLARNLVKAKTVKAVAPAPAASAAAASPSASAPVRADERKEESEETAAADGDAELDLPYDPFVTVKVAQTSHRQRRSVAAQQTGTAAAAGARRVSQPDAAAAADVSEEPSSSPAPDIDIGYQCEALYPSDSRYYSAIITSLSADASQLQVMYLDYGNLEWLQRDQVRNIRDPAEDDDDEDGEEEGKAQQRQRAAGAAPVLQCAC